MLSLVFFTAGGFLTHRTAFTARRQVFTFNPLVPPLTQPITYIEDGSRGIKYSYTPDPKSKDDGLPTVTCTSQAMTATELVSSKLHNNRHF